MRETIAKEITLTFTIVSNVGAGFENERLPFDPIVTASGENERKPLPL